MRNRFPPLALNFLLFAALWLLAIAAYDPGLRGGFLFDDFANLPALGAQGPVDTLPAFWRYVTSGIADPTGRPIALITFLFDAHNWPADPLPFKRTNLILHLANGLLLAMFLRNLGRNLSPLARTTASDAAAVLAAGLWLLHPLFVSTTLYVVQREAMLPATFTLIGLLMWMRGRSLIVDGRVPRGLCWLTLGLGGCTLLGVLSKANGILLPALALLIECVLLSREPNADVACQANGALVLPPLGADAAKNRCVYRCAMWLLAGLPTLIVAAYLVYEGWNGLTHPALSARPWTVGERLLTEPRVLIDYLKLFWLPRPFTPGLFNDQFAASSSLWFPATTLPALLAVAGLIGGAILIRRRHPAWALAFLFFFTAQSLESSSIPLELYFEHRNYLPAMMMFWPLALWLCSQPSSCQAGDKRQAGHRVSLSLKASVATLLVLGLASMTYARADLWGNSEEQAILWAKLNPASVRAQVNAAQAEVGSGNPERAIGRLKSALAKAPGDVQIALNLLGAQCSRRSVEVSTLLSAAEALQTSNDTGTLLAGWFQRAIDQSSKPECAEMGLSNVSIFLRAALRNTQLMSSPARRQDLYSMKGQIDLERGNPKAALLDFNRALDQQIRATAAFQQAALLGAAGHPLQALAHLDHYAVEKHAESRPPFGMPRIHAWVLARQHYWDHELLHLRATLEDDMREHASQPNP